MSGKQRTCSYYSAALCFGRATQLLDLRTLRSVILEMSLVVIKTMILISLQHSPGTWSCTATILLNLHCNDN